MIAQLSQTAMGFVDTLMAGRYGAEDLAAVALGAGIWLPIMLSLGGVLMAITPIVAHQVGANQLLRTRITFNQGLYIAAIASFIAWFALRNTGMLLDYMQVSGNLKLKTLAYLDALSWGVPGMMLYQCCRSYCEGFGKTKPLMKIGILALLCNIPLNYIFIYGKLGIPAMGGVGCGWATSIVMWIMAITAVCYLHLSSHFHKLKLINLPRIVIKPLIILISLGLPIGITLLIEVSMFSVIALMLARLGETVIAAHQITLSFTGMVFMIPLSIAMALTIRIGHLAGSQQFYEAKTAAQTGFMITGTGALLSCTLISLFAVPIAGLYTDNLIIIKMASHLIIIAAIFQIPDAIQVSSAGILRGYKDTQIPLLIVFIAYWVIGLPTGYLLSLTDYLVPAMGAAGFWYGLVIGLCVGAILLLLRYRTITIKCRLAVSHS